MEKSYPKRNPKNTDSKRKNRPADKTPNKRTGASRKSTYQRVKMDEVEEKYIKPIERSIKNDDDFRNEKFQKTRSNDGDKKNEGRNNKSRFPSKSRVKREDNSTYSSDRRERKYPNRNEKKSDFPRKGRPKIDEPEHEEKSYSKRKTERTLHKSTEESSNTGKSTNNKEKSYSGRIRKDKSHSDEIRLNKYIANSGMCSRRDADLLIRSGAVKVNGEIVIEMGYKVKNTDKINVQGKTLIPEKPQYLLLNKPKDYLTTTRDPQNRKTVMELIKGACKERVFPVGRLDRNTTGLLLFTNNGDLAKKLMHPQHKIKKVYHVTLSKNLSRDHMLEIAAGPIIDDERIAVDALVWIAGADKNEVEIHLHSGQYHVVKRIFMKFGYAVNRLDRVKYGPFTKKNLPRGKWRFLSEEEINLLHRI